MTAVSGKLTAGKILDTHPGSRYLACWPQQFHVAAIATHAAGDTRLGCRAGQAE